MKRLLANAIVMASGIALSSQLMALGLGELTLDSALNQPLQASIELSDTDGLTEWDIKPSLASQADFDRAGVDRDFFLTNIKFKVEDNKVILSTKEAVNEPFLNFLLELNWPSGRLLREYTVLLDPPTFEETNFQPLVSGATSTTEEIVLDAPEQPAQVNHWEEAAAPGSYKVQPNDTLWAIALETRPSADVTPQQMMLALQQENPEAFIGGNINRLKSHTVLNIPSEDQVRNIRQEQAIAEVARQNSHLQTGVAQIDATGLGQAATSSAAATSGGEVRLVSASSTTSDTASSSGDASSENSAQQRQSLENDLAIALENVDKSSRENKELRDRLESLQEQIDTLQSLLTLKDDQLAGLQAGQETDEVAVVTEAEEITEDSATEAIDFNYQDEAEATEQPDEAAQQAEEERKAEERRQRIVALMAEQEQVEPELLDELFELLENPAVLGGGAAGLLLILLLIARVLKNRKSKETEEIVEFNDPAILDDLEDGVDAFEDFDIDTNVEDSLEHEGFLAGDDTDSFFGEDGQDAFESDALSDVERSLAYGKIGEALLLLENAIAAEPERLDYRLKQLELLSQEDDEEAFHTAELALSEIAGSEEIAEQVADLRAALSAPVELGTDFASFEEDLAAEFNDGLDFADALDQAESMFDEDASLDLDIPTINEQDDSAAADVPTLDLDELGADLDMDIPVIADEVVDSESSEDNAEDNEDALEFDLGDFSFDKEEAAAAAEPETTGMADSDDALEFEGFDFDETALDLEEEPAAELETTPEAAIEAEADEEGEAEFDMSDFSLDLDLDEAADEPEDVVSLDEVTVADADDEIEALDFDLSAEFEESSDESGIESLESILDGDDTGSDEMPDLDFDLGADDADDVTVDLEADSESALEGLDALAAEDVSFDLDDFNLDEPIDAVEASTDEVLQETADFDSDEIDLDSLASADDEFEFLSGTDECATKLDLARAYIDMEDAEGAKELLQEVIQEGNETQQAEARELIRNL